jgi:hypothetical protein
MKSEFYDNSRHLFLELLVDVIHFFASVCSFSHATVVTYTAKVCAGVALVLLNLFFIYFVILKGAEKGVHWQTRFAFACVFQLLVDGLLFETLECYWVGPLTLCTNCDSLILLFY